MGLSYDQLFPGRFIKSGEFQGKDVTLTISRVRIEELEGDGGKKVRGIVSFRETKKEWVLNRTNGECLKALWGKETDNWLGKRVTLWPAPFQDNLTGEKTTAIRVRGSPDIDKPCTFELKLPRKKSATVTLAKTGSQPRPNGAKPSAPPPEPPPMSDEEKAAILASESHGGDPFPA